MHTNTTGGPTDRPVLHRRPEDAVDQPTTEPSAVERVADLLIEHSRYRIEDCYCGWADLGKSHAAHVAQALADAGLLAPAPQPAADTETEVQWGVRYPSDHIDEASSEEAARDRVYGHARDGFIGLVAVKRTATYTPWEEA